MTTTAAFEKSIRYDRETRDVLNEQQLLSEVAL